MSIIPILKPFNLSKMEDYFPDLKVEMEFPQLVRVDIAGATAQAYRIDLSAEDDTGQIWNVFIYMDKSQHILFGIDNNTAAIGKTREFVGTYDGVFSSLLSHFDVSIEPPRFGDPAQLTDYPEILRYNSFYMEDTLYVVTRDVGGPVHSEPPGRLFQPHEPHRREPYFVLYPSNGFIQLIILE